MCDAGSNQPWKYCILRPVLTYKRFREWATQLSRVLIVVYMHAWTDTLARECLWSWLILQLRRTSRTTLISPITVLDSKGTHGFKLVTMQLPKFAHDTHNLTSALPLRKLPINIITAGRACLLSVHWANPIWNLSSYWYSMISIHVPSNSRLDL